MRPLVRRGYAWFGESFELTEADVSFFFSDAHMNAGVPEAAPGETYPGSVTAAVEALDRELAKADPGVTQ